MPEDGALAAELRLGRIVARADAHEDAPPGDAGPDGGAGAWAFVPLVKEACLLGMLSVTCAGPRDWRRRELGLMQEVAERTWAAIERARAEDSLQRSEQKYRRLFDGIDEAFARIEMIVDDDGNSIDYRFLEVNRAFERQTHLSGVAGRRAREFVPDLEQEVIDRYGRVAATGEPVRFECCVAGMDGRWFTAYAVRVGGAGSREIAVVFDDITERKRTELAPAARAARQAFLLELNDALRPLVQADRVLATASCRLGRWLGVQRVMFAEFSRHGVDVRTDWLDGLAPMDGHYPAEAGRPASLYAAQGARLLVIRDTADPRELPSIDRASYARDGVAALIGASIVYRGQTVGMLRCRDGKRKADRVMEMASRQVKHITRLVDDLMEVSRITRGKIELARQPVLLADVLAGAVETSRPALDGARHAFVQHLPEERLVLDADKVRLTQVFSNLLNNAAKYTDPGGRIELAVRDSGIGIPADKLAQVFGMFAQVEEAGARSQGGLGIGLAMVHKLVEMHGGSVEAKSEGRGRGSEFVVRLPLIPEAALPARKDVPATGARPLAGLRVLIVDDNRDAADSLCFLLASLGVDAHCAYGGEDALRRLPQLRPDAVVLDIGMPGMDGYAVARAIRAGADNGGIRLIALTGWGQDGDRERTRACGFDDHLTKPVDLAALQRLLLEVVRARQPAH